MSLSAVILAGGKSSRMGEDKALLPFKDKSSMASYQYERMKKLFDKVYISTKEDKFDFKANLIFDKYKESSPLVAIVSIFEELNCDAFFLISVDMPLVSLDDIANLINIYNKDNSYDIYTLSSKKGVEPTVAIYTNKILKSAKKMLKENNHKLNYLIKNSNFTSIKSIKIEKLVNLNTKNEYLKYFN